MNVPERYLKDSIAAKRHVALHMNHDALIATSALVQGSLRNPHHMRCATRPHTSFSSAIGISDGSNWGGGCPSLPPPPVL